jgi:hypothetical protein
LADDQPRRAGQLLKEMAERRERRGSGGDYTSEHSSVAGTKLEDLGVTKKQSHNWQKLADVPPAMNPYCNISLSDRHQPARIIINEQLGRMLVVLHVAAMRAKVGTMQ